MTPEEIEAEVHELREKVEDLENEREALQRLPTAVAELAGAVRVLQGLVTSRFDNVDQTIQKAGSVKTAIQFASVVIVPVLVALIGGYFVLKAGVK